MPTALITGGARGIGAAAANALAQAGFRVWAGDRDSEAGEVSAKQARDAGLDVRHLPLDVTDQGSIMAARDTLDGPLDVLVNNAGIAIDHVGGSGSIVPPSALALDRLRATFDVNFFGAVAVTQAFLPLLRAAPAARIVNMSSGLGSLGMTADPQSLYQPLCALAYKSSKAALNMATLLFAQELAGTPIKVNAASPGVVSTDSAINFIGPAMAPQTPFISPEQAARVVVMLATLPSDGPTGEFHDADAGILPW